MRHNPRSDNLPDRSAPSFPCRCSHRKPRATPALATSPPSRCSDKPRPQESEIVYATPPSKLLRSNRRARCPAASVVPVPGAGSTSAAIRTHQRRRQFPQTKTKNHGDRSCSPPQDELRGFYARRLFITTAIPCTNTCGSVLVGLSLRGVISV